MTDCSADLAFVISKVFSPFLFKKIEKKRDINRKEMLKYNEVRKCKHAAIAYKQESQQSMWIHKYNCKWIIFYP